MFVLPHMSPPKHLMHYFLFNMWHMPHPSHPLWFDYPNILWSLQIMNPSLCSFFNSHITSTFFIQNISLSILVSLGMTDQVSHPHKSVDKIIVLYILVFKFFDRKVENKNSAQNDSKNSLNSVKTKINTKHKIVQYCFHIFNSIPLFLPEMFLLW